MSSYSVAAKQTFIPISKLDLNYCVKIKQPLDLILMQFNAVHNLYTTCFYLGAILMKFSYLGLNLTNKPYVFGAKYFTHLSPLTCLLNVFLSHKETSFQHSVVPHFAQSECHFRFLWPHNKF